MKAWTLASALLLIVLTSCHSGSSNPILGKWTAKGQNNGFDVEDMEFTETQWKTSSESYDVTYEINGNVVTIHPGREPKEVCTIDGDSMVCKTIMVGYKMTRAK